MPELHTWIETGVVKVKYNGESEPETVEMTPYEVEKALQKAYEMGRKTRQAEDYEKAFASGQASMRTRPASGKAENNISNQ